MCTNGHANTDDKNRSNFKTSKIPNHNIPFGVTQYGHDNL